MWQFKWTWEDVLRKSVEVVRYAKAHDLEVVYFPYDTTRAREEDLTNLLARMVQDAPPDSVGIVDTMGCVLPDAMKYLVRLVKRLTNGLPVEVHTHNDFGMALATELAGVEAGAEVVHSCANGSANVQAMPPSRSSSSLFTSSTGTRRPTASTCCRSLERWSVVSATARSR